MTESMAKAIFVVLAAAILAISAAIAVNALRALLEIGRISNRRWGGRCLACGYDLTGNVSGTCPECGGKVG